MPLPQAYLRVTVALAAALTLAAVAAHALLVPGPAAARIHGYGACVVGAAVAFFCAATDSRYATAAAVVLNAPALRVAAFATTASSSTNALSAAPLKALASPTLFSDVCLCFAASVALAAPLLAAADPAARRVLGRVAVIATAVVTVLLCPGSVVFDRVVPAAVEICGAVAAASVHRQLALLATALIVTLVMSAAVLLLVAPVPAAAVRCCAAAVVAIVMCLAASVAGDWQSFCGLCPAVVVFGGAAPVLVAQLLRLTTVAVVLPLMVASVAALWEAEASEADEDMDSNDDAAIPECVVVVKQDSLAVV